MIFRTALFVSPIIFSVPALSNEFTPGIAISDAAKISAPESNSLLATVVYPASKKGERINNIIGVLIGAEKTHANIAFVGEDFGLTLELLQIALEMFPPYALKGVTVLYVGVTNGYLEGAKSAASAAGAVFRATKYSGAK